MDDWIGGKEVRVFKGFRVGRDFKVVGRVGGVFFTRGQDALAPGCARSGLLTGDFKGRCSMWVAWGGRCLGSMYQGRLWKGRSLLKLGMRNLELGIGFLCGGSR